MGEKSTPNKDINCKNIDDLCQDNKLFTDPLSYKLPTNFYAKTKYTITQSREEEEEVEPNVFRNSICKAWGDSPMCAI